MKQSIKGILALIVVIAVLVVGALYLKAVDPQLLWYFTRASGIVSYILLFLLTMTGMGITSGFIYNWFGPVFSWRLHRTYGISLVAFMLTHIVMLAYDSTMNFTLADIFVPFYTQFQTLNMSFGIIGFYLFMVTLVTSIVMVVKQYKAWRFVHFIAFPAFILLFLHGVLIGTDSKSIAMMAVYWITGIFVVIGAGYRLKRSVDLSLLSGKKA